MMYSSELSKDAETDSLRSIVKNVVNIEGSTVKT